MNLDTKHIETAYDILKLLKEKFEDPEDGYKSAIAFIASYAVVNNLDVASLAYDLDQSINYYRILLGKVPKEKQ